MAGFTKFSLICCEICKEANYCVRKWALNQRGIKDVCCAKCEKYTFCLTENRKARWKFIHNEFRGDQDLRKRILILTVLTGMGHMRAAEAIRNGIERIGDNTKSKVLDPLGITSPMLSKLIGETYLWMAKFTPSLLSLIHI